MKVTNYLLNQSIRILTPASPEQDRGGRPALIRLVKDVELRYGFLQGPRAVADYNLQSGVTFLEGQFGDTYITKLSVHGNGVLAEANDTTDAIDGFLDDLLVWASDQLGTEIFTELVQSRSYLSQIEVELNTGLDEAFAEFVEFGKRIAQSLKSHGLNAADFEISQLALHCDLTRLDLPKPGPSFILSRRDNEPYEKNLYFASAPLSTKDHFGMLTELEEMVAAKISEREESST
jgi:hypothetical protein